MKIQPARITPPEARPVKAREVLQKKEPSGEVTVEVSLAARTLAEGSSEDRVDLQRVAQLRQQLEAGTYQIDDTALAAAMLKKELLWNPQRS